MEKEELLDKQMEVILRLFEINKEMDKNINNFIQSYDSIQKEVEEEIKYLPYKKEMDEIRKKYKKLKERRAKK